MALEDLTGTKYLDDLNSSNPAAGDNVSEGDDHIRGIKNVLKLTFPNVDAAVNATPTELNYVDGVTSAIQTQLDAKVTNATHTGDVTGATALTIADDAVTAAKLANSINTDIATGVTAGTTASAALPKAGGTMTGNLSFGDSPGTGSNRLRFGAGNDLQIWHNGTNSYLSDGGDGDLHIEAADNLWLSNISGEKYIRCISDGAIDIYHNNIVKLSTTANGITVTGTAIATTDTDTSNSGTVDLDFAAKQNFVLTLTGNITSLTASNEQVGQSGFITFIQDGTGSRTVSLHGDYETAAGAGLTLTSTASATDIVPYVVAAASRILLGTPQLAFS
jgi:hypothetical protein